MQRSNFVQKKGNKKYAAKGLQNEKKSCASAGFEPVLVWRSELFILWFCNGIQLTTPSTVVFNSLRKQPEACSKLCKVASILFCT